MRHDIGQIVEVVPYPYRSRLANIAASTVAGVLKIGVPQVKFFYRDNQQTVLGFCDDDDVIYVGADLDDQMLVRAIIHEARHLWQACDVKWRTRSNQAKERDARLYELAWPR
jgi:hypothetical protein